MIVSVDINERFAKKLPVQSTFETMAILYGWPKSQNDNRRDCEMLNEKIKNHQLQKLREETRNKAFEGGCSCPVCDRHLKVYKRTVHATSARQLIEIYKIAPFGEYVHSSRLVLGATGIGDFEKMKFWGLIESKPLEYGEDAKKSSGYWRITEQGVKFLYGNMTIPKYAFFYNAKCVGFDCEENVNIFDCLGKKFNYAELMKR